MVISGTGSSSMNLTQTINCFIQSIGVNIGLKVDIYYESLYISASHFVFKTYPLLSFCDNMRKRIHASLTNMLTKCYCECRALKHFAKFIWR